VIGKRSCEHAVVARQPRTAGDFADIASYLGEISPAPENIINRDFQAAAPNEKWLTDITEFQIPAVNTPTSGSRRV